MFTYTAALGPSIRADWCSRFAAQLLREVRAGLGYGRALFPVPNGLDRPPHDSDEPLLRFKL